MKPRRTSRAPRSKSPQRTKQGPFFQPKQGGDAAIQRNLPNISLPRMRRSWFNRLPAARQAELTRLMEAYSQNSGEATGQAMVNAITQDLESQNLVHYTGRPAVINPNAPDFRMRPSMRAGGRPGVAGITFGDRQNRNMVEIYPQAFIGRNTQSQINYLAGILIHEYIHVLQNQGRRPDRFSDAQREVQAWLWQAEHARQLGIPPNGTGAQQIRDNLRRYFGQLDRREQSQLRARVTRAINGLNASP